jgi:hypothetical protein
MKAFSSVEKVSCNTACFHAVCSSLFPSTYLSKGCLSQTIRLDEVFGIVFFDPTWYLFTTICSVSLPQSVSGHSSVAGGAAKPERDMLTGGHDAQQMLR